MSSSNQIDPANAYDAFRWAFGITMVAWRIVTGKPGQTTEKQRARKAAVVQAFDGTYVRTAEYATPKARKKAARASLAETEALAKVVRKARKAMPAEVTAEAAQTTLPGTGKVAKAKPAAKRPAGDHIYAMRAISLAFPGEPNGKVHPYYAATCAWVNAFRAENPGTAVSGALVANAIHAGEIAPAPRKGKGKGDGK